MATEEFDNVSYVNYGQIWSGQANCRVENEWSLPDYKEAAQRLLRVDADPRITGKNVYQKGQELICEVEGEVYFDALYLSEDNAGSGLSSFAAKEPFYYTFHIPFQGYEFFDPALTVSVCESATEELNARLLGPRRLSARCNVKINLSLRGNREITCLSDSVPADVETRVMELKTTVLSGIVNQQLTLKEILSLPVSYPPVREMIDFRFSLYADRVKVTDGNVDFTGHLSVNAAYLPDGDNGLISFCQPLEFEKSIGTALAEDGCMCEINLTPASVQMSVEMGESGENKDIALEVTYLAELRIFRAVDQKYLADLYSVNNELEIEAEDITLPVQTMIKDYIREVNAEIPLKRKAFLKAEDIRPEMRILDSFREGKNLIVTAEVILKYLAMEESGEISASEDKLEIKFDVPDLPDLPDSDVNVELSGDISNASLSIREDVIDVKMEVFGRVTLTCQEAVRPVTDVIRKTELEKIDSGLLFYYPDSDETLWDVCKKCRARMDQVRSDNAWDKDIAPAVVKIIRK